MTKIDEKILEKYFDGELSDRILKKVQNRMQDTDLLDYLEKNQKIGDLIRLMDEEKLSGVSFEGLSNRVLATSRKSAPTPWFKRVRVWFAEFLEHRRLIWIPAAAVGAVAITLLFLPLTTVSKGGRYQQSNSISLHSATPVADRGSTISAVDFGGAKGMTYSLENEFGASVGVVWIVEKP